MFDKTTKVQLGELTAGMIVKHGRAWVRIHHIELITAGSNQRKATCTLRHQMKPGAFTVWFGFKMHKVLDDSLPAGFAIRAHEVPVEDETMPPTHEHAQEGVHNVVHGEVRGSLIQMGLIEGDIIFPDDK